MRRWDHPPCRAMRSLPGPRAVGETTRSAQPKMPERSKEHVSFSPPSSFLNHPAAREFCGLGVLHDFKMQAGNGWREPLFHTCELEGQTGYPVAHHGGIMGKCSRTSQRESRTAQASRPEGVSTRGPADRWEESPSGEQPMNASIRCSIAQWNRAQAILSQSSEPLSFILR
jgi:hypothetical protein